MILHCHYTITTLSTICKQLKECINDINDVARGTEIFRDCVSLFVIW